MTTDFHALPKHACYIVKVLAPSLQRIFEMGPQSGMINYSVARQAVDKVNSIATAEDFLHTCPVTSGEAPDSKGKT